MLSSICLLRSLGFCHEVVLQPQLLQCTSSARFSQRFVVAFSLFFLTLGCCCLQIILQFFPHLFKKLGSQVAKMGVEGAKVSEGSQP
jgi:hypothetical protein